MTSPLIKTRMANQGRPRRSSRRSRPESEASSRISKAIFVIVCLIPIFTTVLFGGVDNTTWAIVAVVSVVMIVLWIAESWNAGGILLTAEPLQIPLIGLFFIGIVHLLPFGGSSEASALLAIPASGAISLDPYSTRFFLSKLLIYVLFFGSCLTFINSEARVKKAAFIVVTFGAVMAFFGIMQRLANPDGIYGMRETPQAIPFGPFVNQHHFATFMQMTAGITLGFIFGRYLKRDRKVILLIAFVLMCVAAILTSSRGGLLGMISVAAFVSIVSLISGQWSRSESLSTKVKAGLGRNVGLAAASLGIGLIILGVVIFIGGGESLLRGIGAAKADSDFSSGRSHYWPIAIKIFLEHPIIGAGFESFGAAFTRFDTWGGMLRVEQAHNDYLQILAEGGIAGIICVGAFIFLLFRRSLKAISDSHGPSRDAAIGALAGCFGVLIHSFFDFPLRTPSNAFFFLVLCSIAVFAYKNRTAIEP
jgi:O-antigen ligase